MSNSFPKAVSVRDRPCSQQTFSLKTDFSEKKKRIHKHTQLELAKVGKNSYVKAQFWDVPESQHILENQCTELNKCSFIHTPSNPSSISISSRSHAALAMMVSAKPKKEQASAFLGLLFKWVARQWNERRRQISEEIKKTMHWRATDGERKKKVWPGNVAQR